MKIFKILLLILVTFSSSCISIKSTATEDVIELNNATINKINGTYSNVAKNKLETEYTSLWKQMKFLKKDTIPNWEDHKVELKAKNKHRIEAKLWYKNVLVSQRMLRGRIRDNHFSVKRQIKIVGVPFIFFFTKDNKYKIGLTKDNQLLLNRATDDIGMIFLMSAGKSEQFNALYTKE
ncbi:hypothetical protein [Cellulophaga fucicola]|uniref:Uncharacterized protein n=1 Tax=Cellulophaga fucicola TaxID=76595 RepID=A0A1K1QCZ4_9FLAO|nr:hypothetical protein [Cellulophaga fucicola]SFW57523.1 hypothetical protein SAMN05660313_02593 [Cellulophaga fucicola]